MEKKLIKSDAEVLTIDSREVAVIVNRRYLKIFNVNKKVYK